PEPDHATPVAYPYPDGCGSWQQADVRTARDRLGWRPRINLEESLADIWMEAACRI
ncbi:reductase, partial [Streptomyces scabiei]|nr:reductase [Streptomyces scabiei]MDX2898180.1 reductase [Streptomyces scabiei]MDX3156704.1 reductase [Streptomyces scabiei]